MALVLIATPGAVDANTYCTLAEAGTYFESRLYPDNWYNSPNRNAALAWATMLLDSHVEWRGTKVSQDQALEWPRLSVTNESGYLVDSTSIPLFLKRATAEFAMWLSVTDRTADPSSKGVHRVKIDTIEIELDKLDRASVLPDIVYQMVAHYGVKKTKPALRLQRTRGAVFVTDSILARNIFE